MTAPSYRDLYRTAYTSALAAGWNSRRAHDMADAYAEVYERAEDVPSAPAFMASWQANVPVGGGTRG